MRNKISVMMIGGGIQEVKAVEIAKSAGYNVIVTDRNSDAPCFPKADHTATIDGRDIEGLIAYTLRYKEILNISGVFTLTELVTSVAAVANACDLPGVSLASAVTCQNKQICKEIWLKNKIQTPRGQVVTSIHDARILFNKLNKRVFVKPLIGYGGKGAQKILTPKELEEYFSNTYDKEILMEELLIGSMHDVNGLIDRNGRFHPMGIVDRFFLDEYPVEKEISTPSIIDQKKQGELYNLLERSVRSLGINWGPVKGDAILVDGNLYMFEVAPRLHGPKNSLYLLPFSGFNCLDKSLGTITGRANNNLDLVQNMHVVCTAVLPEPGTTFNSYKTKNKINYDGVVEVLILKQNGELIQEYFNSTDVPAYIFTKGLSAKDCENTLKNTILFEN